MRETRWRQFDFVLLGTVVALVSMGVLMIHSTTCGSPCEGIFPLSGFAQLQGVAAVVGFAILAIIALLDYRFYRGYAYHIYGLCLALLVLVLLIGRSGADDDYGARRWIYLGAFDLQPSELTKIGLGIGLARLLGDKPDGALSGKRLLGSIAMLVVPFLLVFSQPDLGTALSFIAIWLVCVSVAGVQLKHALVMAGGFVLSLPLIWLGLKEYMRDRIITFIGTLVDLEHAAFDEGYNVLQARISIGSGGFFGRGYLEGTQTQLDFLRIKHSDFIFSSFAEELGFIGAMVLFFLFTVVLFRITRAGDMSRDEFGRYLAFAIAAKLLFQAVANLGANLTLLPVTGIPLPFVSYGRTALLTNLVALGMVQSVLLYRLKYRY